MITHCLCPTDQSLDWHLPITIITLSVPMNSVLLQTKAALHLVHVALSLGRFQVHYRIHSPGKAKRLSTVKRKGCPVEEVGLKQHRRTLDVGRADARGMANKENELTCSDDVRGNAAEASKMAGASSKYSDFTEVRVTGCTVALWW